MKILFIVTLMITINFSGCTFGPYYPEVPRITKEELKKVLTDPEIIIIDVRKKKNGIKAIRSCQERFGKNQKIQGLGLVIIQKINTSFSIEIDLLMKTVSVRHCN